MKNFNNVTREEVARVFEALGSRGFNRLAISTFPVGVKYGDQTMGKGEAISNLLLPEEWEAVLKGEKELFTKDAERPLVDRNGRVIPAHVGVKEGVCDEETDFYIKYPAKFDYAEIIKFYERAFHQNKFLKAAEFEDQAEKKKELLMRDKSICNLIKRALPLPTPQCVVNDYSTALNNIFIPAAKNAYKGYFPSCHFDYCCSDELRIRIAHESQKKFIDMLKNGPDVVWYFPNSMQGFSSRASIEAMNILGRKPLVLAGVIEPLLGLVGYTNKLAKNIYTPGYLSSGVCSLNGTLLVCESGDDCFKLFNTSEHVKDGSACHSSGLVFIG